MGPTPWPQRRRASESGGKCGSDQVFRESSAVFEDCCVVWVVGRGREVVRAGGYDCLGFWLAEGEGDLLRACGDLLIECYQGCMMAMFLRVRAALLVL